jgi:hypothetical protein
MIGKKFNRLTVLKETVKNKRKYFVCKCDCGNLKEILQFHVLKENIKSCGCLLKEKNKENFTKHGKRSTRLYEIWKNIRSRCNNKNNPRYKDYGGRNIKICKEWEEFNTFYSWSIKNSYKETLQIDRINNDFGYFPENCRWTTSKENNRNRRITVKVEGLTLKEISEKYDFPYNTLKTRYYYFKKKKKPINIKMLISR